MDELWDKASEAWAVFSKILSELILAHPVIVSIVIVLVCSWCAGRQENERERKTEKWLEEQKNRGIRTDVGWLDVHAALSGPAQGKPAWLWGSVVLFWLSGVLADGDVGSALIPLWIGVMALQAYYEDLTYNERRRFWNGARWLFTISAGWALYMILPKDAGVFPRAGLSATLGAVVFSLLNLLSINDIVDEVQKRQRFNEDLKQQREVLNRMVATESERRVQELFTAAKEERERLEKEGPRQS